MSDTLPIIDVRVPVDGYLSPGMSDLNDWATHKAKFGQGGFEIVETIAERDAIVDDRKTDKMVFVKTNAAGDPCMYYWDGSFWEEYDQSSSSFDLTVSMTPDTQYGSAMVDKIRTETPLMVMDNPDEDKSVKMYIKHDAFEAMHNPSFLAYLDEDEDILSKVGTQTQHHDGKLWFDDVVKDAGSYIQTDRPNKAYGIQEADQLDPNVSGGTDYLVSFRIGMKGKAPNNGLVRAYLFDRKFNTFAEEGILTDKNGHLMAVEKHYNKGDDLGKLDITSVVNAKGLQEFTCHVMDDFVDDNLVLCDRTESPTGLMIQALTSTGKTGEGLVQYQLDTGETINFSSHYLGASRASIGWLVDQDMPIANRNAGTGMTMADGYHFYNVSDLSVGVDSGMIDVSDNGKDIADFSFGKVFSSEETLMLRGHVVEFDAAIVDKDCAYTIALMKWTGTPDQYTPEIFESRNNDEPVFQTGWVKADSAFISEDVVSGLHAETGDFTVPDDANNYAVVIYPRVPQQPMHLKLKKFNVDVKTPFTGYAMKAPKIAGEQHLAYSDQYKQLTQDVQGYASLRYTLDTKELPMPCGELGKGAADINIDTSVNQVPGSAARGGEGAVQFQSDGKATVSTQLNVWNEQSSDNGFKFWYATVGKDKRFTKIPASELDATIKGNTKGAIYMMPTFTIDVEAGDRIALRSSADVNDGAYIQCVNDKTPLVQTDIKFKELVTVP